MAMEAEVFVVGLLDSLHLALRRSEASPSEMCSQRMQPTAKVSTCRCFLVNEHS